MAEYKLNFSLTTEQERCELITQICSQSTYTPTQYTQMADYILLANKQNNIYPEQFTSPKIIHQTESLDTLMDDPLQTNIVENTAQPIQRSIYYKQKRTIDRTNPAHAAIPGMLELWHMIDYYKQSKDWRKHKLYISLCQQQYTMLDASFPPSYIPTQPKPTKEYYSWTNGVPLNNGLIAHLDLTIPNHMAKFLIYLPYLKDYCDDISSDLAQYLSDVEQAMSQIKLTPLQKDILTLYQERASCKFMQLWAHIYYNRNFSQSYPAIILYNQIALKAAEEYTEIIQQRLWANKPEKWRVCSCCKEKKILTKHNWYRSAKKPQGFSLICKSCIMKKKKGENDKN